jgi:hypothetical protein
MIARRVDAYPRIRSLDGVGPFPAQPEGVRAHQTSDETGIRRADQRGKF